jgi:hypothetical protein
MAAWWAVTASVALTAFVLGGVSAHLLARRHHWHPDYGDVPTWVTAFVTLFAAVFALGQLWLLNKSQRQANEVTVRAQAGALRVTVHPDMGRISLLNSSDRPIRNVRARVGHWTRVYNLPVEKLSEPDEVAYGLPGEILPSLVPVPALVLPPGHRADLYPGQPTEYNGHFYIRFADDTGIEWEIDHNLHLQQPSRPLAW